ncbi:MAG: ABC transporter permease [Bryobacterales bacterium]|nr:ABC transporter permease [Bryobacterales bacterium]
MLQDLRFAARQLWKSPGFTISAVVMLAVGIGVNIAAFSFFNLMMLRTLPVRSPETLVRVHRSAPGKYWSDVPYPAIAFYRDHARTLTAVLALHYSKLTVDGDGGSAQAHFVSSNLMRELGGTARMGRVLDPALDERSGELVVVLGAGYWERQFGGDAGVVGRLIKLNGQVARIVGVASADFSGLTMQQPDLWLPIGQKPRYVTGSKILSDFSASDGSVDMWGRLAPGTSAAVAEQELQLLAAELRKQEPGSIWENERLITEPGGVVQNAGGMTRASGPQQTFREKLLPVFALIGTLAFLILAVACGNLGSLLLARGSAREREMSIRISVGAGSGRLVRQLLTESALLAGIGTVAGVGLGWVVLRVLLVWTEAPAWVNLTPDWRVAGFATVAGFVAALLFGLAPAMQIARQRFAAMGMRQVLIGTQVASSCVLLVVSGLLVRALEKAVAADLGFEFEQVVAVDARLGSHGYAPAAAGVFLETLKERLRGTAGIEAVGLSATPPLGGRRTTMTIEREGRSMIASLHAVDSGFFGTVKIQILRGRALERGDRDAVVVSDVVARFRWPGEDALGRELEMGDRRLTVLGVAADARLMAVEEGGGGDVYELYDERNATGMSVLVRASGPAEGLATHLREVVKGIDGQVVPEVSLLKGAYLRKVDSARRSAMAVSVMGGVALVLACLGIVGLVSFTISRRMKEIGIRIALGASPLQVVGPIAKRFAMPVGIGLGVGLMGAAGVSALLKSALHGVSHLDPVAYLGAVVVFLAAAVAAGVGPARRALQVDVAGVLRGD